jgi:predicted kinase
MTRGGSAAGRLTRGSPAGGRLLCVGGPPGSGKTTVGRCLAGRVQAAVVDLDSVTTPLVQAVAAQLGVRVALDGPPLNRLREARYECLAEVIQDIVTAGVDVVAVAPFTREAADARSWRAWGTALGATSVTVCWLDLSPERARARVSARGLARDLDLSDDSSTAAVGPVWDGPGIDLVIDATAPTDAIITRLRSIWPG